MKEDEGGGYGVKGFVTAKSDIGADPDGSVVFAGGGLWWFVGW